MYVIIYFRKTCWFRPGIFIRISKIHVIILILTGGKMKNYEKLISNYFLRQTIKISFIYVNVT